MSTDVFVTKKYNNYSAKTYWAYWYTLKSLYLWIRNTTSNKIFLDKKYKQDMLTGPIGMSLYFWIKKYNVQ